jgi:hypothetical protein
MAFDRRLLAGSARAPGLSQRVAKPTSPPALTIDILAQTRLSGARHAARRPWEQI